MIIGKLILYIALITLTSCHAQTKKKPMPHKIPNKLITATSPYLLQHAYNPVTWYPWGEEALEKAKTENKPIIVSIGYSACHWCHVMEHQSFENDSIAALMNKHFVCIKVDREERPDIDQIYMDALQAMGQHGGWPLNVFLTPDQKPFYGGTYFPPEGWAKLLTQVAEVYKNKQKEIEASATELTAALAISTLEKHGIKDGDNNYRVKELDAMYNQLAKHFDQTHGGSGTAPKFPMPSNWLFLLRYYQISEEQSALQQLETTLIKMAEGGIYDQVGGGFARYATDSEWLIPHFEKMLYDNGQLTSLYAEAYTLTGNPRYKTVVYQTIDWLEREMIDTEGGFYAALDADSEGEEGRFYVWDQDEFNTVVGKDAPLLSAYYNTSSKGNWEGKNILNTSLSDEKFAKKQGISIAELQKKVTLANKNLLTARNQRIRPGLDDKILAGWNGLMLKGLVTAYEAFGEEKFLTLALRNAQFIDTKMCQGDKLYRTYKNGQVRIDGYLEDYAFVIDGYLALYQATFEEKWLQKAKDLTEYTIEHFYDPNEKLFFYTADNVEKLIARKKEVFDNVIPASNSQMAINLYFLGKIYDHEAYHNKAKNMITKVSTMLTGQTAYLSHWGNLYTSLATPTAEIAIVGPEAVTIRKAFNQKYYPNKIVMGTDNISDLPLLKGKEAVSGKTTIYVCYDKTCQLPVHTVKEAWVQLK